MHVLHVYPLVVHVCVFALPFLRACHTHITHSPPNSPDLNLIEVVWSWMVRRIRDGEGGWPSNPQDLKARVLQAWDDIPLDSFRELIRSYRVRLEAIHSVDGNRHPQFA